MTVFLDTGFRLFIVAAGVVGGFAAFRGMGWVLLLAVTGWCLASTCVFLYSTW